MFLLPLTDLASWVKSGLGWFWGALHQMLAKQLRSIG